MQTHKGQYLPLLTMVLPDKMWSVSGLPGKLGPDLQKPNRTHMAPLVVKYKTSS